MKNRFLYLKNGKKTWKKHGQNRKRILFFFENMENEFEKWNGQALITSLKDMSLRKLDFSNLNDVNEEIIFKNETSFPSSFERLIKFILKKQQCFHHQL